MYNLKSKGSKKFADTFIDKIGLGLSITSRNKFNLHTYVAGKNYEPIEFVVHSFSKGTLKYEDFYQKSINLWKKYLVKVKVK